MWVVVVSDFYWRSPLLFEFILVVASSCLSFELLRCLWCFEGVSFELSFFFFMLAPSQIMLSVLLIVCWILMGRFFSFKIGCWRLATFVWLALMFLRWTGGKGCPPVFVVKSSGRITFDSRSGVSFFSSSLVLSFIGVFSVDRRLRGGGS